MSIKRISGLLVIGALAACMHVPTRANSETLHYGAASACIAHTRYRNDVLPANAGEFGTHGLDRAFWGGKRERLQEPKGTWGPGFFTSWGRHQYDTYFADPSDGLGIDPFAVVKDTAVAGAPTALRIAAFPMPKKLVGSLAILANDQWVVTSAAAPFAVPREDGSLVVNVANPNGAQNGWKVGMGYASGAVTFVGTLTSGGATPSSNGTGGGNPWTISDIHIYSGAPGTTIVPKQNDEGGLRAYNFPEYVSGALDTNIQLEYGFFVSRMRMPDFLPALSPAFWTLETGGVAKGPDGLQRNELDIAEMFANTIGNALNANEILWNTKAHGGKGLFHFPDGQSPQSAYHDYGALVTPNGVSFYLDGNPIDGDTNLPDWTQDGPEKELMLMFQVGNPGGWLDRNRRGMSNPWPQYVWSQWIRVYRPTSTHC